MGNLFKIYVPIITSLVMTVLLFSSRTDSFGNLKLNFFNVLKYELPIQGVLPSKLIMIFIIIISLSVYIFYDYTNFFDFKMKKFTVFFDSEGIDKCLKIFTPEELSRRRVRYIDYQYERDQYYARIDRDLNQIIQSKKFLISEIRSDVVALGMFEFNIEKIKGFQRYRIGESEGYLKHTYAKDRQPNNVIFRTHFIKVPSQDDHISVSFIDLYTKPRIIVMPRYEQTISDVNFMISVKLSHEFISMTKISFLPFPKFSNTLHLVKASDSQDLIPVCYSVYK